MSSPRIHLIPAHSPLRPPRQLLTLALLLAIKITPFIPISMLPKADVLLSQNCSHGLFWIFLSHLSFRACNLPGTDALCTSYSAPINDGQLAFRGIL